ncbi:TnsA endonuclease N-terminal domain-containing protein [uncultured Pelagimonas sp.]|uniref:TnsA endonuclease N-terminal domain-containing protein n=1 Tax=uncultured Pelagimonas sp. TaxID=1618102 RepID=UPI00260A80ED|nr:TnsA endonuclease N-terminal domain-containing protein [uncultured Pelagimonas sp.]
MNMSLDHALMEHATSPEMDLSGMPEAFQRAYGPTEPFENDFVELEMPDLVPLPYRGNRKINPRSRGSTRIFSVWLDLQTRTPRNYGFDSQVEYHNGAVTLIDPSVAQIQEQFGPIPFIDEDGKPANHYIDLLITKKSGRKIAVAVKPTKRLKSGRFMRQLEALQKTMPSGIADELRLVTEACIPRAEAFNAVMYQRFSLCRDIEVEIRLRDVLSSATGDISICDLAERCRAGGRAFRPIVRGIFEGLLAKQSSGRINLFTKVRRLQ